MVGILDTIKLGGTLLLAIPAALAGIEFIVRGTVVPGVILLILAVTLVLGQHYLTLPTDIPSMLAKQLFGSVVGEETDEERE